MMKKRAFWAIFLAALAPLSAFSCSLPLVKPDCDLTDLAFDQSLYFAQGDTLTGSFSFTLKSRFAIEKVILSGQAATITKQTVEGDQGTLHFSLDTSALAIGRYEYHVDQVSYVDSYTQERGTCTLPADKKLLFPALLNIKKDNYETIKVVDQAGTGDYLTLTEGLAAVRTLTDKKAALLVKPGNYVEPLDLRGNDGLDIYGTDDPYVCIYSTGDYPTGAALRYSGTGYFYGLSFISSDPSGYNRPLGGEGLLYEGEAGAGRTTFRSCIFASSVASAASLYFKDQNQLTFEKCQFQGSHAESALLIANDPANGSRHESGEFSSCYFASASAPYLQVEDRNLLTGEKGNTGGEMTLTFQNNVFAKNEAIATPYILQGGDKKNAQCLVGSIYLGAASTKNGLEVLNAL
jgi:hypothetical protein